jgi:MinD superfamily P-loop ATPase
MTPRQPGQVETFATTRPERPYVEVALAEVRQESAYSEHGPAALLDHLRTRAAERGCEGLIIQGPADKTIAYGTTLRGYRAVCIVYRPRPAATIDSAARTEAP